MARRRYHLKEAVNEVARPILEMAGFNLETERAIHGDNSFTRQRPDGLIEAVSFGTGKGPNDAIVELALIRAGYHPLDALFTGSRFRLDENNVRVGVRDSLGRIVHGDRWFLGRDGFEWDSEEQLKARVREAAELALRHGPSYWNEMAKRMASSSKRKWAKRFRGSEDRK